MSYPRGASNFRYACGVAIGVAIVVAVVRTWFVLGVVTPVAISSGSMAPRLLGPHCMASCAACGARWAIDASSETVSPPPACPNCNAPGPRAEVAIQPGTRVVVDRTAWLLAPPKRWQVVVFRCPEQPARYCAKRVVGLPCEQVEIRQGQVFVDGVQAQKGLIDLRSTGVLVHELGPAAAPADRRGWRADTAPHCWQRVAGGYKLPAEPGKHNSDIVWLRYKHGGPILDDCAYNADLTRQLNRVGDLRVAGTFRIAKGGVLQLQIDTQACRFSARIDTGRGRAWLFGDDQVWASIAWPELHVQRPQAIEFANVDGRLLLAVDDQTLVADIPPELANSPAKGTSPVAIGGQANAIEVTDLRLWRDVYYTAEDLPGPGWGIRRPVQLGPDEYFVLGDNSPISHDSRTYARGAIPRESLVGRPIGY